jgi:hypothetical protein
MLTRAFSIRGETCKLLSWCTFSVTRNKIGRDFAKHITLHTARLLASEVSVAADKCLAIRDIVVLGIFWIGKGSYRA